MNKCIRAARAVTLTHGKNPVIEDFALIHDGERILETGTWSELKDQFSGEVEDLGDVAIVPGLINAHVHLELSHLKGKTVQEQGFTNWIKSLLSNPLYDLDTEAVRDAVQQMRADGTAFCVDISTRNCAQVAAIMDEFGMGFYACCEAIGVQQPKEGAKFFPQKKFNHGRSAGSGHSLYSTGAELLQAVKAANNKAGLPYPIHLAENEEEDEIVAHGTGEFAGMLKGAGLLADCGSKGLRPVEYADSLGLLDDSTLAVHCVRVAESDINILAERKVNVCLCPRSNTYIGEGRAPWEKILKSGINTCLGTDSIASNHDLSMWNELEYLLKNIKISLSTAEALALVTTNSAKALKIDDLYGSLDKGKRAVYATIPAHLEDLLF
ncbi:amidohydrolase family protein [Maridesulfovibrio salexigens]|uniref:Amidohydrolase n=1 Tax=Maridesulfovibrio salexigens (strain ATCC 14822 / DSM 2638 / NCIMB 8403 / VKM B-1763) TaxID=526222 RepID=C6BUV3_MARSD|nr:amidohydrolase family protein [Maridesulfovibrio salexigens]ACS78090.1 amidohydrolase [Maridesulfovibrio salexigens DSM 2638]